MEFCHAIVKLNEIAFAHTSQNLVDQEEYRSSGVQEFRILLNLELS